jgi:hypothetical protein
MVGWSFSRSFVWLNRSADRHEKNLPQQVTHLRDRLTLHVRCASS